MTEKQRTRGPILWSLAAGLAFMLAALRGTLDAAALLAPAAGLITLVATLKHRLKLHKCIAATAFAFGSAALASACRIFDQPADWATIIERHGSGLLVGAARSIACAIGGLAVSLLLSGVGIFALFGTDLWDRVPRGLAWLWQALPVVFLCSLLNTVAATLPVEGKVIIALGLLFTYPPFVFASEFLRELTLEQRLQLQLLTATARARFWILFPALREKLLAGLVVSASWSVAAEVVAEYYLNQGHSVHNSAPYLGVYFISLTREAGGQFVLSTMTLSAGFLVWKLVRLIHTFAVRRTYGVMSTSHQNVVIT